MCMGPPFFHSLFKNAVWVYPHVYGATDMPATPSLTNLGLSPCVWGHLAQSAEDLGIKGSITMCMGPPKHNRYAANPSRVYPHVYGATDMPATPSSPNLGLSPCVWGHLAQSAEDIGIKGSIPMCMGPPKQNRYAANPSRVYPHVYGAT